jgi:hypothetical protein
VIIVNYMLFFSYVLNNEVLWHFLILLADIINILQRRINPDEPTNDEEAKWRRYLINYFP